MNNIRSVLAAQRVRFSALLDGDEQKTNAFLSSAVSYIDTHADALRDATDASIVDAIASVAMTGLSLNPKLGHVSIVTRGKTASMSIEID